MKRLMVLATLAASVTGCVANQGDAPVRFLGARALKSEAGGCGLGDIQLAQGTLDVSGGGSYILGVNVETNNVSRPIVIEGETFSGPGLNDINMREVVLTYQSSADLPKPLPTEERIPYYAVFRPGTTSTSSFALMFALGPEALEVLRTSVGVGQTVTVLSTLKAVGQFSGGLPVETNKITFPIVVYNSGFDPVAGTCPGAGQQPSGYWGPCRQVGQDTGPICVVPPPVPAP